MDWQRSTVKLKSISFRHIGNFPSAANSKSVSTIQKSFPSLLPHLQLKNTMKRVKPIAFIVLSLAFTSVFAQKVPLTTDRPDQTESSNIVLPGHLQIEHCIGLEKIKDGPKLFGHPSTLFRYGVNESFELRLVIDPNTLVSNGDKKIGISPVEVGIKMKLTEEKGALPDLALLCHLQLSGLASEHLKSDHLASSFRFNAHHTLSSKSVMAYNLGMEWDGEETQPPVSLHHYFGLQYSGKGFSIYRIIWFYPSKIWSFRTQHPMWFDMASQTKSPIRPVCW